MRMTQAESIGRMKVGDKVRFKTICNPIRPTEGEGIVAEVTDGAYFLHNDFADGSNGSVKPRETGFKYSWEVSRSISKDIGWIEIISCGNGILPVLKIELPAAVEKAISSAMSLCSDGRNDVRKIAAAVLAEFQK